MNKIITPDSITENDPKHKLKKIATNLVKLILTAVILYYIFRTLSRHWNEVVTYDWTINYGLLALSVFFHLVTFAIQAGVWCILISGFGYKIPFKYGFKISYITNLGRYLPGKVWAVFGMAYLAKKLGIKGEASVTSWIIAIIFSLPTAFLGSFLILIFYPELLSDALREKMGITIYVLAVIMLAGSLFLIITPNKTLSLFNIFLKIIRRPAIVFDVSKVTALKIYLGYFLSWISFGFSFWLLLHAIIPDPQIPLLAGIGAYVFAYQIGFVAIFTPGGIGVREFALWSMLTPYIGSVAIGVAIAARIWNIIAEIIAAVIALVIKLPE